MLPIWLHSISISSISRTAGKTCNKCSTKYLDWVDAPECSWKFSAELPWESNSEEVKAERWKEGENAAAIPFHSNCGQQPTAMQEARLRLPLCAKFKVYSTNLAEGEWAKKVRTLVTCGKENFGYNAYCWETKGASIKLLLVAITMTITWNIATRL